MPQGKPSPTLFFYSDQFFIHAKSNIIHSAEICMNHMAGKCGEEFNQLVDWKIGEHTAPPGIYFCMY